MTPPREGPVHDDGSRATQQTRPTGTLTRNQEDTMATENGTSTALPTLPTIDDLLGPSASRFFGSGYRGTDPRLRSVAVRHDGAASRLDARGSISVAERWSTKGDVDQLPHLSTTDVLVLGVQAAEILLAATFSPAFLVDVVLRRVVVVAGKDPVEGAHQDFAVSARLDDACRDRDVTVHAFVGTMTVEVTVHRPLAVAGRVDLTVASPDELLGAAPRRVHGSGYAGRSVDVRDVATVGHDEAHAQLVAATLPGTADQDLGIGATARPSLSFVEAFVATLQLAQVLLYELDHVPRAESSTLWMRRTVVESDGTALWLDTTHPIEVALVRPRLVVLRGETWRCTEARAVVGHGTSVRCDVAHRIPSPPR
ncbi:hypothetical protein DLJ96_14535 [Actinotalea fermentans ATCC 43279 = JCM 9966 = DSM 3133]|nr:hypothetical protein DLJ96_14535 [Actinotalea fermentans ATCC 43279 = JCM 9966 = DSM 3133]